MDTARVRLSTIATAQDVLRFCAEPTALADTAAWCRGHGIGKVYLETYRGTTQPAPAVLAGARRAFESAGIEASGCICTTNLGADSDGWPGVPCFSRGDCAGRLEELFRSAAPHFDELIIDNRLFTDCCCPACQERRGEQTWTEFRQDLMVGICADHVVGPALEANPRLRLVLKYPSWYEGIALRGYDVIRHTGLFHAVCAGAETRDPRSEKWGKRQPFGGFFTAHWYHQVCGDKCMGTWVDTIACSPQVFMAQVRGSVLAGAREVVLFCMGLLRAEEASAEREILPGAAYLDPLCAERERLDRLAGIVAEHPALGVAAYRDPRADAGGEPYLFEHLGMAGIPVVASPTFPTDAPAAAFGEASCMAETGHGIAEFAGKGKLALVTSRLAGRVGDLPESDLLLPLDTSSHFFPDRMRTEDSGDEGLSEASGLAVSPPDDLLRARRKLLAAVGCPVDGGSGVGVTLLGERYVAVQNFTTDAVVLRSPEGTGTGLTIAPGEWQLIERQDGAAAPAAMAPLSPVH